MKKTFELNVFTPTGNWKQTVFLQADVTKPIKGQIRQDYEKKVGRLHKGWMLVLIRESPFIIIG